MKRTKILSTAILMMSGFMGGAVEAANWHWDSFSADSYSGQVQLKDNTGASFSYDRYDGSSSSPLWGSSAVQSLVVVAGGGGSDMDVNLYTAGGQYDKYECPASKEWKVYVTPVQMCNNGYSTNIGGFRVWAVDYSSTEFQIKGAVFNEGLGWREITGNCGVVQVSELCK